MSTIRPMKKAGSLRTGQQGDMGSVIHAVPSDHADCGPALCGQQPAIQWSDCEGREVTCPRCMRTMARQSDLFGQPPRQKPRRLMHVVDAGNGPGGPVVQFACRCGYESGWLPAGKLSDDKRGRPCPRCNPTDGGAA